MTCSDAYCTHIGKHYSSAKHWGQLIYRCIAFNQSLGHKLEPVDYMTGEATYGAQPIWFNTLPVEVVRVVKWNPVPGVYGTPK